MINFQNGGRRREIKANRIRIKISKMCGICCCLFADNEISRINFQVISDCILPRLERRGPDHTGRKDFHNKNDRGTFHLSLTGTLLHLRGRKTPQPLLDDRGNILLWNGEIFGGIEVKEKENDSLVLLKILSSPESGVTHSEHILSTMAKVQGPWSIVYWQATEQKLWFGRDYFGRRSLLWHLPSSINDVLAITSVTERNATAASPDKNMRFEEIPADGLYCVDLVDDVSEGDYEQPFRISKYEWNQADEDLQHVSLLTCPVTPFNKQMPNEQDLLAIEENRRKFCLANKREMCGETEERFVRDSKALVVQESCMQGASKESVVENDISIFKFADNDTGLDNLENEDASFKADLGRSNEDCIDATLSLTHSAPARNVELNVFDDQPWQRSNCNSKLNEGSEACFMETSTDNLTPNEVIGKKNIPEDGSQGSLNRHMWNLSFEELRDRFIVILGKAVKKRVFNLPRTDSNSILPGSQESSSDLTSARVSTHKSSASSSLQLKDARVGILFSGGIDSMMIAALADKFVPTEEAIDLINVAFEQKPQAGNPQKKKGRKGKMKQNATTSTKPAARKFSVPDRVTGLSGLEELQSINPARQWNFIEVDVTLEELQEERSRHISHLVSPLKTVLDDSIGCALWFAARGRGRLLSSVKNGEAENQYTSKSRVLLVGMGADEQLGGYARHRTRFINEGWTGLMDEMEMEVKRISKRNLGRDDRCISDHGREARFPFLDEEVVCFLNSLPVWIKTDPGLPRGTGEKLLLRQAARLLGLTSSSELPKRAIQFGSRIAKLESCGEKGSEACARLEF